MSKPGEKIIEGLQDAVVYAKIDALWRRTKKKHGEEVTQYDWGYRDGVMAARALFGTEHVAQVPAPAKPRPLKTTGDNQRKGAVKSRSQTPNPITGTWTKRDDRTGKFMDVKADAKPFKGVRKEKKK